MIIKFNLLPKKEEVSEAELKKEYIFLKIFIVFIILSFGFIIFEVIKLGYEMNRLKSRKTELEKEFRQYQSIDRQVKRLEQENKDIKRRIETIINLKKMQAQQFKKIESIIASINKNKIYFNKLYLDFDQAKIDGISFSLKEIAEYLNRLEKQKPLIKGVNVVEIKKKNKYISFKTEVTF